MLSISLEKFTISKLKSALFSVIKNRKKSKLFLKNLLTNAREYGIIYTERGKENRPNQKEKTNDDDFEITR
jgi:hypothetical protein